jgi:hypothetical protein
LKYKNLNKTLSLISLEDNYTNKKNDDRLDLALTKKN